MEKCKFCEAELNENYRFCPICGKELEEPSCEEECACGEECTCDEGKPKKKGWKIGLLIAAGVVLLGVLAAAVLHGVGIDLRPRGNGVTCKDNYTVDAALFAEHADVVVATAGGSELTNTEFQLYYWSNVLEFLDVYGAYGIIDTTKGLHEQSWDDKWSYQQFFVDLAMNGWQETQILCALAKESDYQLSEELEAEMEALTQQLPQMLGEDYATVDEMLQDQLFPGITEESYLKYVRDYYTAYEYRQTLEAGFEPTDAQLEAYFTEHEEGYAENGVTKQMMKADVRHILLEPANGTLNEANVMVYSEADWADCLVKAQNLLNDWKNGAATEASFAELANTHSVDPGSNTTGGLYEDITPDTNFVPSFLDWTVDPARKVGDTDIVQSDYGYHIMYYVGGEPMWGEIVREDYINENVQLTIDAGVERWPMAAYYKKVVVGDMSLSG